MTLTRLLSGLVRSRIGHQRLQFVPQCLFSVERQVNGETDVASEPPLQSTSSDDPNASSSEPWKTLLEMPARAAWRVSSPTPPLALTESQREILKRGHLSNKNLKQAHHSVIQSHKALALRRERERTRMMRELDYKKSDERRDAKVAPVFYGPDETLAAFKFRLYPNYSVVKRVLLEAKSLLGRTAAKEDDAWKPKHVVDFGIGCGSASLAAMDVWDGRGVEWIHGIDPSETMREGTQAFFAAMANEPTDDNASQPPPRLTMAAHLSAELAPPSFDLALMAYTATELPHGASILTAAAILWEKLLPNGLFVMIEPGTPDGFQSIRIVRNMLLDCAKQDADADEDECDGPKINPASCCIIAPCTHNGPCPMERYQNDKNRFTQTDVGSAPLEPVADPKPDDDDEDDGIRKGFCSFVQTMPGDSGSSKGEKFSYLVAQKRSHDYKDQPNTSFENVVGLLQQTMNADPSSVSQQAVDMEARFLDSDEDDLGLELLRGDANRTSFGRIVRSPLKKKGHILVEYCSGPGRIGRQTISKSMSNQSPGLYAAARKSRWGGFWPNIGGNRNESSD
jgi:ribosomal protein RSM22 (predicted rRNA methylase)